MAKKLKVSIDGVEYALTRTAARGSTLPKRYEGTVEFVVNGEPANLRITDNVAFAGSRDAALQYVWIYVDGEGAYYATLGYGELAADLAGATFDVTEGVGPKPVERAIDRSNVDRARAEFDRMTKFSATWAKR